MSLLFSKIVEFIQSGLVLISTLAFYYSKRHRLWVQQCHARKNMSTKPGHRSSRELGSTLRCHEIKAQLRSQWAAACFKLSQASLSTRMCFPGYFRSILKLSIKNITETQITLHILQTLNLFWILNIHPPKWFRNSLKYLIQFSLDAFRREKRMQFLLVKCTRSVWISITVLLKCGCLCFLT